MMVLNLLAAISISNVAGAGVTLLVIGLVFVLILSIAYAKLRVEQDPTVEAVLAALPGANCGGCGLAGCGAYAEVVVADHGLMGKCGPGGDTLVREIAALLGIEAAASAPVRAVVHCGAKRADLINSTRYGGAATCGEGQMVAGVMGCPYGCMGFGDCAAVCEFDAIDMVDGLATVNYDKCVGCGACVQACPRGLITLEKFSEDPLLIITCSSRDKVKEVRGYCKVGCVGCGLCAKLDPNHFQMEQSLAVIDYEKYGRSEEFDKAVEKCPRACMLFVGKKAPAETNAAAAVEEYTDHR